MIRDPSAYRLPYFLKKCERQRDNKKVKCEVVLPIQKPRVVQTGRTSSLEIIIQLFCQMVKSSKEKKERYSPTPPKHKTQERKPNEEKKNYCKKKKETLEAKNSAFAP